jgi:hypothetical protein
MGDVMKDEKKASNKVKLYDVVHLSIEEEYEQVQLSQYIKEFEGTRSGTFKAVSKHIRKVIDRFPMYNLKGQLMPMQSRRKLQNL